MHETECRAKELDRIYSIKDNECLPDKLLYDSNFYKENREAITLECDWLKPKWKYDGMTLRQFILDNSQTQDYDRLSARMMKVIDWERRIRSANKPEGVCEPCTTSLLNAPNLSNRYTIYCHKHYSTRAKRLEIDPQDGPIYACEPCKRRHHIREGERIPLIATSGTMYRWFVNYEKPVIFHIEYEQIRHGGVEELHMAVQTQYDDKKRPIDLLIFAGLPELLRGEKAKNILESLESFKNWAVAQNTKNTVAIASIPEAPTGSKDILEAEFADQTRELNAGIILMNDKITAPYKSRAPKFHIWGTKKAAEDDEPRIGKANSLYNEESDVKLRHQQRIGNAMVSYFKGAYGLLPRDREEIDNLTYDEARKRRNRRGAERKKRRKQMAREAAAE